MSPEIRPLEPFAQLPGDSAQNNTTEVPLSLNPDFNPTLEPGLQINTEPPKVNFEKTDLGNGRNPILKDEDVLLDLPPQYPQDSFKVVKKVGFPLLAVGTIVALLFIAKR